MATAYTYTILLTRYAGEDDGESYGYHDGTDDDAMRQVRDELQEAMEMTGQPVGHFTIVKREQVQI